MALRSSCPMPVFLGCALLSAAFADDREGLQSATCNSLKKAYKEHGCCAKDAHGKKQIIEGLKILNTTRPAEPSRPAEASDTCVPSPLGESIGLPAMLTSLAHDIDNVSSLEQHFVEQGMSSFLAKELQRTRIWSYLDVSGKFPIFFLPVRFTAPRIALYWKYMKYRYDTRDVAFDKLTEEERLGLTFMDRFVFATRSNPGVPQNYFIPFMARFYSAFESLGPEAWLKSVRSTKNATALAQRVRFIGDALSELAALFQEYLREMVEFGFPLPYHPTHKHWDGLGSATKLESYFGSFNRTPPRSSRDDFAADDEAVDAAAAELETDRDGLLSAYEESAAKSFRAWRGLGSFFYTYVLDHVAPEESALNWTAKPNAFVFSGCNYDHSDLSLYNGNEGCTLDGKSLPNMTCCGGGGFRYVDIGRTACAPNTSMPARFDDLLAELRKYAPDYEYPLALSVMARDANLELYTEYRGGATAFAQTITEIMRQKHEQFMTEAGQVQNLSFADVLADRCAAMEGFDNRSKTWPLEKMFDMFPEGCRRPEEMVANEACPFDVPECESIEAFNAGNCSDPSALALRGGTQLMYLCGDRAGSPSGGHRWNYNDKQEGFVAPYEDLAVRCPGLYSVWLHMQQKVGNFGVMMHDLIKAAFYTRGPKRSVSACVQGMIPDFRGTGSFQYIRSRSLSDDDPLACDTGAVSSWDFFGMIAREDTRQLATTFFHEAFVGHGLQIERATDLNKKGQGTMACQYKLATQTTSSLEGYAMYADKVLPLVYGHIDKLFGPYWRLQETLAYNSMFANGLIDVTVVSGLMTFTEAANMVRELVVPEAGCPHVDSQYACTWLNGETKAQAVLWYARSAFWFGQMSSYSAGFMVLAGLHDKWIKACGEKFDIKEFHYALVHAGLARITVMEEKVNSHMAALCGTPANSSSSSGGGTSAGTGTSNAVQHLAHMDQPPILAPEALL